MVGPDAWPPSADHAIGRAHGKGCDAGRRQEEAQVSETAPHGITSAGVQPTSDVKGDPRPPAARIVHDREVVGGGGLHVPLESIAAPIDRLPPPPALAAGPPPRA